MSASADPPLRWQLRRVTLAWVFGSIWLTATAGAPLAEFATELGAGKFTFGLIAAAPFAASLLSLPASFLIERLGRKPVFLAGLLTQRLLWLVIAAVPGVLAATGHDRAALLAFLGVLLVMYAGQAVGGPGWMAWMADLVPRRVRGAYFAKRRQIGCLAALPTALVVGLVMDRLATGGTATLVTCGVVFAVAAVAGIYDILLFRRIPERPAEPGSAMPGLGTLTAPLKDRQFLTFALYVATITATAVPVGQFITLYLLKELAVSPLGVQVVLLVLPNLVMIYGMTLWGRFVDTAGKKPALIIGGLGLVPTIAGWAAVGHLPGGTAGVLVAAAVLVGTGAFFWGAVETANFNYVLEFAARRKGQPSAGSGYAAVSGVITNVAGITGGLAFGGLVAVVGDRTLFGLTGYDALFLTAATLRLAALGWLIPLRDTRARPTRDAARLLTANVYSNMASAILLPTRLGRLAVRETFRRKSR